MKRLSDVWQGHHRAARASGLVEKRYMQQVGGSGKKKARRLTGVYPYRFASFYHVRHPLQKGF